MSINAHFVLAIVPMRKEPSDKSEMVNQALFGESCTIIDENEKWYLVELSHDNYQGWVDKKQVAIGEPSPYKYIETQLITSTTFQNTPIHITAGAYSPTVTNNKWTSVIDAALPFLKSPYLWGGRSCLGIDCSGFTQIAFRLAGKKLLRDAYQQAEQGELVSFLDEAQSGDLAFFDNADGRVTHVGIIISGDNGSFKSIIHASGEVRIDDLDNEGIYNKSLEKYTHRLRTIRRV